MKKINGISDADIEAMTGPFTVIKNADELKDLCDAATSTFDKFDAEVAERMTPERSQRIRELRIDLGGTWRYVAGVAFEEWGDDATWGPPSNQLAGMALCKWAAIAHNEDYCDEPWN